MTANLDHELVASAAKFVVRTGATTVVAITRRFHVGNRTARDLLQLLEDHGVLGHRRGDQPREVLVDRTKLDQVLASLPGPTEGE